MAAHQLGGVGQHRQGANAQQIDLGQADGLDVAVVELGDQKAFGRPLHRHNVGQRAGRHHQAAGMDAQVMGLAEQPKGGADDSVGACRCISVAACASTVLQRLLATGAAGRGASGRAAA